MLQAYDNVFLVGVGNQLPEGIADKEVAIFWKENNCDLVTGDKKAYLHYLAADMLTHAEDLFV